jgi:dTDP-4-dehydrorhamnose 3,5-epimerase
MRIVETAIPKVLIIEPDRLDDARGSFMEVYRAERYAATGISRSFVQDNLSCSHHGVLRGLHLQNPNSQGKLMMVLRGQVLDVAVDVRVGSPTFGQHVSVELDDEAHRQLWLPAGFAHGFLVLSERADVFYKCDAPYSPADEITLRWDDPTLAIRWGIDSPILSPRDATAPRLDEISNLPLYRP